MKVALSPEFTAKFPSYTRFVVVAKGLDNSVIHPELQKMLNEVGSKVRKDASLADPSAIERIKSWREAFKEFGADPNETAPSVQSLMNLARRDGVEEGKDILSYHNTVVAISNYISLKHLVPSGADDLGKVRGDYGLQLARGKEVFVALGSNDVEYPRKGEVILTDGWRVMCRNWVWKQSVHTMVSRDSRDVAVNVDVLPPVTRSQGEKIAQELTDLLQRSCGGEVVVYVLDQEHPAIEFNTPPSTFEETVYDVLEARGYIQRTSSRLEVRRLLNEGRLVEDGQIKMEGTTVYQGFDPTKPSLHVGHLMSLMVFHYLQEAGIRMIFILGGGTAQVGDPSERAEGRKMITSTEVAENAKAVKAQVQRMGLVNFDADNEEIDKPAALMLDNAEWLHMDLLRFLRDVTPHFSVNRMIKRDDFHKRLFGKSKAVGLQELLGRIVEYFKDNETIKWEDFRQMFSEEAEGLTLFEFNYTALQGFDYLYLFDEYDCVIQMGGNDQWMNILDGMELIRRAREGADAFSMVFPLLTDRSGQKMGKTAEGETIWLAGEGEYSMSPFDFYQYWLGCPDEDLERNFKLFTFLSLDEIGQVLSGHPRDAQHRLALEVTAIVHGEDIARQVQKDASRAFGDREGLPEDVPTFGLKHGEIESGVLIRKMLANSGFLPSISEAQRRIQQGGVRVNDVKVLDVDYELSLEDFIEQADERAALVRYGKGKIFKVVLEQ